MQVNMNKFQDLLLYSDVNVHKTLKSIVNESCNAALVSSYADKCVLLDHQTGQFYGCNYDFNQRTGVVVFENFDPIEIEENNSSLREAAENYFEDENTADSIDRLKSTVEDSIINNDAYFKAVVAEAITGKNFDAIIDYSCLEGLCEETKDIQEMSFFKKYQKRIENKPMTSVKYFSWNKPVKISLIENENTRKMTANTIKKANNLSKDPEFRKQTIEAFKDLMEDKTDLAIALIEDFPGLFLLDKAQRKEVIGKSILSDSKLIEKRTKLFESFDNLYESDPKLEEIRNIVFEAEEGDDEGPTTGSGTGANPSTETDDGAEKEEDEDGELTDKEIDAIVSALTKAVEKAESSGDSKLADKIEKLSSEVENGKEEGTSVAAIKEAVEILSL